MGACKQAQVDCMLISMVPESDTCGGVRVGEPLATFARSSKIDARELETMSPVKCEKM